jgi:hypothetical protein
MTLLGTTHKKEVLRHGAGKSFSHHKTSYIASNDNFYITYNLFYKLYGVGIVAIIVYHFYKVGSFG